MFYIYSLIRVNHFDYHVFFISFGVHFSKNIFLNFAILYECYTKVLKRCYIIRSWIKIHCKHKKDVRKTKLNVPWWHLGLYTWESMDSNVYIIQANKATNQWVYTCNSTNNLLTYSNFSTKNFEIVQNQPFVISKMQQELVWKAH